MLRHRISKCIGLLLLATPIVVAGVVLYVQHNGAPAPGPVVGSSQGPQSSTAATLASPGPATSRVDALRKPAADTRPSLAALTWRENFQTLVDRANADADPNFRSAVLFIAGLCSIVLSGETLGPDHFQAAHGALVGAEAYQRWNQARARIQPFCAGAGSEPFAGMSREQRADWSSGALARDLSAAQLGNRFEEQRDLLSRALANPEDYAHALHGWVLRANGYFNGQTAPALDFAERAGVAHLTLAHLDGGRNPDSLLPEIQCATFGHCLSLIPTRGTSDERRARIENASAELYRRLKERRWGELLPTSAQAIPAKR